MRVALSVLALALVGGAIFLAAMREQAPAATGSATPAAAPPALSPKQVHDCADECDQIAVVEQRPDEWLRACRARCRGQAARQPYTPIRRITVAPADHHR